MTDYWAVGMLNADKIAPALQPLLSKIKKRLDDDSVSGIPDVELQLTEHRFDRWMNQLDRLACKSGCDAVCIRAPGDVLCECCGKPYRKHRYCAQSELPRNGSHFPSYFLHVLCSGTHVKL